MIFGREVLIGIVVGFAAAWAWHRFAVPSGMVPAFPIFSRTSLGTVVDWKGVPYNQANPGR